MRQSTTILDRQIVRTSGSIINRTDNVQRFFRDIDSPKYQPLDDSVIRKMFEDRETFRDLIINANIRLVATIAKTYDGKDKFMDFLNEGVEGLVEAFEKYDPTSRAKFSTYASYWIGAKMSMLCREFDMVQSSNQGKIGSKARKFQEQFFATNMRDASAEEIVEYLAENHGIDIYFANEVFGVKMESINAELDDDGNTPESCGEFAVRTACENEFNEEMDNEEMSEGIGKMMKVLTEKEKDFITRHICNGESYYEIGITAGCTDERVRQIVVKGLEKMKKSTAAKKYFACFLK